MHRTQEQSAGKPYDARWRTQSRRITCIPSAKNNFLHLWSVWKPIRRRRAAYLTGLLPPISVFTPAHFELERLGHEVESRRILGSRLLHRTLSDINSDFKSQFINLMRVLPLAELTNGRTARTRAFCATTVSSVFRRAHTFSRLFPLFLYVTCSASLDAR